MIPLKNPRLRLVVACAAIALLGVVAVGGASAAPVATSPACWKSLLGEWYSGSISTIYAHDCYVQALNHLPTDIEEYSSARQDITNAMHAAAHDRKAPPETKKFVAPSSGTTTTSNGRKHKGGIGGIVADLTPGNPQAFPLPLLVLGALAIVLVIAGGAGMIWQRRHPGSGQ